MKLLYLLVLFFSPVSLLFADNLMRPEIVDETNQTLFIDISKKAFKKNIICNTKKKKKAGYYIIKNNQTRWISLKKRVQKLLLKNTQVDKKKKLSERYRKANKLCNAFVNQQNYSIRFFGNGYGDIDRIKIKLDSPAKPIDIGDTDFTIELWLNPTDQNLSTTNCSNNKDSWINGNVVLDRDIYGDGENGDYGISLMKNKIAFGVNKGSVGATACSNSKLSINQWSHIAVTRKISSGELKIFINGKLDKIENGPAGDITYFNNRYTDFPNSDPFLVIGAEKHDAGSDYPSYNGYIDEIRISNTIRYSNNFSLPTSSYIADSLTVALYHFDEGLGAEVNDSSENINSLSNGKLKVGGSPKGPVWSKLTPF